MVQACLGFAPTGYNGRWGGGSQALHQGSFPVAPDLTMLHAMLQAKRKQKKDKETPKTEALLPC